MGGGARIGPAGASVSAVRKRCSPPPSPVPPHTRVRHDLVAAAGGGGKARRRAGGRQRIAPPSNLTRVPDRLAVGRRPAPQQPHAAVVRDAVQLVRGAVGHVGPRRHARVGADDDAAGEGGGDDGGAGVGGGGRVGGGRGGAGGGGGVGHDDGWKNREGVIDHKHRFRLHTKENTGGCLDIGARSNQSKHKQSKTKQSKHKQKPSWRMGGGGGKNGLKKT